MHQEVLGSQHTTSTGSCSTGDFHICPRTNLVLKRQPVNFCLEPCSLQTHSVHMYISCYDTVKPCIIAVLCPNLSGKTACARMWTPDAEAQPQEASTFSQSLASLNEKPYVKGRIINQGPYIPSTSPTHLLMDPCMSPILGPIYICIYACLITGLLLRKTKLL